MPYVLAKLVALYMHLGHLTQISERWPALGQTHLQLIVTTISLHLWISKMVKTFSEKYGLAPFVFWGLR